MDNKQLSSELHSIRSLMERSAKFVSLSGLSGILAGVYALVGMGLAYPIVYGTQSIFPYRDHFITEPGVMFKLACIGAMVLIAALATAFFLSRHKARKQGQKIWNPASKGLLISVGIPLVTGGLLILILVARGWYGFVAPACLIFYGLALVAGSRYTYKVVEWLGILQVVLGLLAAALPGYGMVFWGLGFGVLHIVYGSIMHAKYDRRGDHAQGF